MSKESAILECKKMYDIINTKGNTKGEKLNAWYDMIDIKEDLEDEYGMSDADIMKEIEKLN